MNKHEFEIEIKKVFGNISTNFFILVEEYKIFLQDYNQKINLTRLDTDAKIYGDYFYESVIPYKNLDFSKINKVLDIGSGSGIPGVVLKLLYPHINLTIIESNNKKVTFLRGLSKQLNVEITLFADRAESIAREHNEQFDLVTSRAVALLPAILEISMRYLKIGGLLIEPKSHDVHKEANDINDIVEKLGGTLVGINSFVSVNGMTHNVVVVKKEKTTNPIYPRTWIEISKGWK